MTPDDQLHLRFALAKAYEDAGDQEAAFAQLLEANRLKRGLMDYDERAMEDLFARIKATFTEERMNSRGARIAPAEGPIFIVGMMRSGSTLVEQILASHPQVFGAGELTLFKQAMSAVIGRDAYPTKAADLSTEALRQLGLVYRESLQKEAPAVRRITDKFLHNFLYCGLIALALPDARILHTRRDPVDTCLSCFSKLFVGEHPYSYDLAELGRYYRAYDGLMAHWRQVLPAGMMLEVDYERVVDDLEGQARLILDFCGLPWDDAVLSFHQTARPVRTASALQVRQPIYKSAVGRWRPEEALLKPLLDALT
jgi:tetratricopeptide (TPR) repeat protein